MDRAGVGYEITHCACRAEVCKRGVIMAILSLDTGEQITDTGGGGVHPAFNGTGDIVLADTTITQVGDRNAPGGWGRLRGFVNFDISSLVDPVQSAVLSMFYSGSEGDGVNDAAPDSADVGHLIVDHMENYLPADITDYQAVSKTSNIGTLIPNDTAPQDWYSLNITASVNIDISDADTPDNSCYRLRQSIELPNIDIDVSNYWILPFAFGLAPFITITLTGGQIMRAQIFKGES